MTKAKTTLDNLFPESGVIETYDSIYVPKSDKNDDWSLRSLDIIIIAAVIFLFIFQLLMAYKIDKYLG